jgi:hypothetical protein
VGGSLLAILGINQIFNTHTAIAGHASPCGEGACSRRGAEQSQEQQIRLVR